MRKTGLLVTLALVAFFVANAIPTSAKPGGGGGGSGKAPKLNFSSANYSRAENGVKATLIIKKSGQSKDPTTVQVSTGGGTATPGADYTSVNQAIVIAANAMTAPVEIFIANDGLHEGPETVEVHLGPPLVNGQLQAPKIATLTIFDDEVTTMDVADDTVTEGNDLVFNVTLSDPAVIPISANFATAPGTAVAPADFTSKIGQVTFGPGDVSEDVHVTTIDDPSTDEPDQDMTLTLSSLSAAASAGDLVGKGTIQDNDDPPLVFVGNNPTTVEGGNLVYDVTLAEASEKVVSVDIADDLASATPPGDYTANSDTLTWNPGDPLTQQFTLATVDDTDEESDEAVWGLLSNPVNAVEYVDPDDFDNFENTFFLGDSYGRGEITDNCTEDGFEDNDTSGTATAGTPGTDQNGTSCVGDHDWFSYGLTAGDDIDIDVLFTHSDGDVDITLFDPNGSIVASDAGVIDDAHINHTAALTGTYTLRILHFNGNTGPTEGNPYTLDAVVNPTLTGSFFNAGTNLIPASGTLGVASIYPFEVTASGMDGELDDIDVHLNGLTHTWPDDIQVLLVAPTGDTVHLMGDMGNASSVSDIDIIFNDAGAAMPDESALSGTTYAPGTGTSPDFCPGSASDFPPPAPAGPYGTTLGSLDGIDPNGTWQLFVRDDCNNDTGNHTSWSVDLTTTE